MVLDVSIRYAQRTCSSTLPEGPYQLYYNSLLSALEVLALSLQMSLCLSGYINPHKKHNKKCRGDYVSRTTLHDLYVFLPNPCRPL